MTLWDYAKATGCLGKAIGLARLELRSIGSNYFAELDSTVPRPRAVEPGQLPNDAPTHRLPNDCWDRLLHSGVAPIHFRIPRA